MLVACRPLRVMFVHTFMPVGGAETLLVNLIRRLDRDRFIPEVCCLKYPGPLGEVISQEVAFFSHLLRHKYDLRVLPKLTRLLKQRKIDAVVTVGAGDRMFWGRLAAKAAGVPVILTALHSTGWPDVVGRLNRMLTPITDGFIGVAQEHGRYLREVERFPAHKVFVIPNGVDVQRFQPRPADSKLRAEFGLDASNPVAGIVAALRPEKNHEQFLRAAAKVRAEVPAARFLIVGDGETRPALEQLCQQLGLTDAVIFAGTRSDVPELLSLMDVVTLTSHMEANPVTILEAMACGKPFVAPRVGSIPETIVEGETGYLTTPGSDEQTAARLLEILRAPEQAAAMGQAARRRVVEHYSLECMVNGYQDLITRLYLKKRPQDAVEYSPASETNSLAEAQPAAIK